MNETLSRFYVGKGLFMMGIFYDDGAERGRVNG
jgi:hypothetical protein